MKIGTMTPPMSVNPGGMGLEMRIVSSTDSHLTSPIPSVSPGLRLGLCREPGLYLCRMTAGQVDRGGMNICGAMDSAEGPMSSKDSSGSSRLALGG